MSSLPALTAIVNGNAADGSEVEANFSTIATFVDGELINRDGSIAMTAELTLSSSTPSGALVAASKGYVDNAVTDATTTGSLDSGNIRYVRVGTTVHVWTTASTTGATLPAGFRPAAAVYAAAVDFVEPDWTVGQVQVGTGGVIQFNGLGTGTFSLSFSTV